MINPDILNGLPHDFVILMDVKPEKNLEAYDILDQLHSKGICITLNKPAHNLKDLLEKRNIKTEGIHFIDTISNSVGASKDVPNCSFISSPENLTALGIEIDRAANAIGLEAEKFLILDSLPTLAIYHKEDTILQFMNFLVNRMGALRMKGFIFNIEENVSKKINNELNEFCDKTIRLE